jgi:hypothetical protein
VEVEGIEWMDIDGDGVVAMGPVTCIHTYIQTPGTLVVEQVLS